MDFKRMIKLAAAVLSSFLLANWVSAAEPEVIRTTETDIPTAITVTAGSAAALSRSSDALTNEYGYTCLADTENGAMKQQLYVQINAAVEQFHYGYKIDALENDTVEENTVAELNYSALGLTKDDAIEVWLTYKNDHPLYYWISSSVMYNSTSIYLLTDDLYAQGSERERYNALIAESIEEYSALTEGENSAYRIAMAYHDAIIEAIDYAYKADGTPEDAVWAHNILGVFEEKGGVCESYARTFQLLLDYAGVENIYVTGEGNGEAHAWNLVKLDDGEWYWCDLTWDDEAGWMWGIKYHNFCVNDTQNLNWMDGGYIVNEKFTFMNYHTPDLPTGNGLSYLYPLPERAADAYLAINGELLLKDVFTAGQFTCAVAGFNTVQVTEINCTETDLVIPETVEYNGVTYDVISIGGIDENGLFTDTGIGWSGISPQTITLPANMRFIWDYAFSLHGVKAIYVDAENPYFCSDNGVLYTKDFVTLIRYPNAAEAAEYQIPDETYYIAYGAFDTYANGYSVGCENLAKITFGANLEGIGITNWGNGYPGDLDAIGSYVIGGFERISSALTGNKEIYLDSNNKAYIQKDGIIYLSNNNGIWDIVHVNKNILSTQISENVQTIPEKAFEYCTQLTEIIIPDTITTIETRAFRGCTNLKSVKVYDTQNDCVIESKYDVSLPESLTQMGDNVFMECSAIESAEINGQIEEISYMMFYGCKNLRYIWLSESVKRIGEAAFIRCDNLMDVYFEGDVPTEIGADAFCSITENLTLHYNGFNGYKWTTPEWLGPDGVTYNTETFKWENDPETGKDVVHIHDYALWLTDEIVHIRGCDCDKMLEEELHEDADDDVLCDSCGHTVLKGLKFGIINDGVRILMDVDTELETVTIPASVQIISEFAFEDCTKLKEIEIPEGVEEIGILAFSNCTALTKVVMPNTLTTIKDLAFYGCTVLEQITFPASLTTIGESVLGNCGNLKDIYFMGDVPSSWEYVFTRIPSELILHYRKGTSGWSSPTWQAPDGMQFRTAEFTSRGDMDGDGILTAIDVDMLARYFAGNPVGYTLPESADLDADGVVERREVMILTRYCAGWSNYGEYFD